MSTTDDKHHVYDDIVEHDNKLPLWWQLTLYGAVVFALVYWFGRRIDAIASPAEAYAADVAAQHAAEAERARARGTIDDAMLATLAKDPATVAQGKEIFTSTCAPCHKRRRRRQHRPEPDRRVLAPRRASRPTSTRTSPRACPPRACPPGGRVLGDAARRGGRRLRDLHPRTRTCRGARRRRASSQHEVSRAPACACRSPTSRSCPRRRSRRRAAPAPIQPADVRGRFHRARTAVFVLLIGLWAALPWVQIGGHPAVFLDVDARELFLFGATFNAQDTWLLFFLLTGVGFGLVYATALAGRVWCGWACPQTVFLEGVYRRIERLIEGPREKRMRRNAGPMDARQGRPQGWRRTRSTWSRRSSSRTSSSATSCRCRRPSRWCARARARTPRRSPGSSR